MTRVFVKVCGITSLEDAEMAVAAGADALGFNFWPKSPRHISPQAAAKITANLGSGVVKVGVFVDASVEEIMEAVRAAGLDLAQIHGELPVFLSRDRELSRGQSALSPSGQGRLSPDQTSTRMSTRQAGMPAPHGTPQSSSPESTPGAAIAAPFAVPFWQALSAGSDLEARVRAAQDAGAQAVLIDTPSGARRGGTGRAFDWSLVRGLPGRIVLAGGLGPDNVAEAIKQVQPWGVDACSRIESSPGHKDAARVRAFIKAVRVVALYDK